MSLHYLDDFILVANDHLEAVFQKNTLKNSVGEARSTYGGLKIRRTFSNTQILGIKVHTFKLQLHLPPDKLS